MIAQYAQKAGQRYSNTLKTIRFGQSDSTRVVLGVQMRKEYFTPLRGVSVQGCIVLQSTATHAVESPGGQLL